MKKLLYFLLGVLASIPLMIGLGWLRQFILEPDYMIRNKLNNLVVRCDGGNITMTEAPSYSELSEYE